MNPKYIKSNGYTQDLPSLRFILHTELSIILLSAYTRIIHDLRLYKLVKVEGRANGKIEWKKKFLEINKCDKI